MKMFWKVSFLIFTLCSGHNANTFSNPVKTDVALEKFTAALQGRCLKNADANAYDQLKASTDNLSVCMTQILVATQENNSLRNAGVNQRGISHNCLGGLLKNADSTAYNQASAGNLRVCMTRYSRIPVATQEEAFRNVCVNQRQISYNCLAPVLKNLEPCLYSDEKYLPAFVLAGHNLTFGTECEHGYSRLNAIIPNLHLLKCDPPAQYIPNVFFLRCLPKLRSLAVLLKPNYILTKSQLCSDIKTTRECISDVIRSHCTIGRTGEKIIEFLTSIFEYYLASCGISSTS